MEHARCGGLVPPAAAAVRAGVPGVVGGCAARHVLGHDVASARKDRRLNHRKPPQGKGVTRNGRSAPWPGSRREPRNPTPARPSRAVSLPHGPPPRNRPAVPGTRGSLHPTRQARKDPPRGPPAGLTRARVGVSTYYRVDPRNKNKNRTRTEQIWGDTIPHRRGMLSPIPSPIQSDGPTLIPTRPPTNPNARPGKTPERAEPNARLHTTPPEPLSSFSVRNSGSTTPPAPRPMGPVPSAVSPPGRGCSTPCQPPAIELPLDHAGRLRAKF